METGCPLQSALPHSLGEASRPGEAINEIRAYKLGKKRWSYNSVQLQLGEAPGGSERVAAVAQVVHTEAPSFAAAHQDSAVAFQVHLESGARLQAHVYLCFEGPRPSQGSADAGADADASCSASGQYAWNLVTRQNCCKGCDGRVLRSIQRFGRLGKRAAGSSAPKAQAAPESEAAGRTPGNKNKDLSCMYLSLDEACTHVGASAFRLVAGIYNRQGTRLLTTAVSPPIRVLANNDAPTGAAHIVLQAQLPSDWEGWSAGGREAGPAMPLAPPSRSKRTAPRRGTPRTPRKIVLKRVPLSQPVTRCLTPPPPSPLGLALPLGIDTPNATEAPHLLRTATAPQLTFVELPACGDEAWQGSSKRVARQLSLPALHGAAAVSGDAESGGSCGAGPCPEACAAPVALPPPHPHPFLQPDPAAMQREADRQLFILQQLKAHMAVTDQPAYSCCGGGSPGQELPRTQSCAASLQQQMLARSHSLSSTCAPVAPLPLQRLPAAPASCRSLATSDLDAIASQYLCLPPLCGLEPEPCCDLEALELEELHSMLVGSSADKAAMLEMESLLDADDVMLAPL